MRSFKEAVDEYILGNWDLTKMMLEDALRRKRNDGPTLAILNFMQKHDYKPPANWQGNRAFIKSNLNKPTN